MGGCLAGTVLAAKCMFSTINLSIYLANLSIDLSIWFNSCFYYNIAGPQAMALGCGGFAVFSLGIDCILSASSSYLEHLSNIHHFPLPFLYFFLFSFSSLVHRSYWKSRWETTIPPWQLQIHTNWGGQIISLSSYFHHIYLIHSYQLPFEEVSFNQ